MAKTIAESAGAVPAPEMTYGQDTTAIPVAVPAAGHTNGTTQAAPRIPSARRRPRLKAGLALAIVGAAVAFVVVRGPRRAEADSRAALNHIYHFVAGPERTLPPKQAETPAPQKFNGTLAVSKVEREALGLRIVPVEAQVQPIRLELNGTTDFDQNTLAKVRPLFDARVAQVFKTTGNTVKKGEPLVELYSTDLAKAKADFRSKYAKWEHDKKFLDSRGSLHQTNTISYVAWVDTMLAEMTSRVDYITARENLYTFGISAEEVERLVADVMDPNKVNIKGEDVRESSRLILKAPIDGMIVERDVVAGNFYDDQAVVMVISPMDKLWVWGNVYEKDQADVHLGQNWEIQFPYLDLKVNGTVEHIEAKVDPTTRTLRIRATIPNPNKQLKSEMRAKAVLEIPAVPGQTVIPRNAMTVINGENCCFIVASESADKFEFRRRMIEIDQESHDFVVVKSGLKPGEKVVTNGSLILSQLYEDQSTVDTGLPMP